MTPSLQSHIPPMVELRQKLDIQSSNYLSVLETIKSQNHQARLIGGVVRDSLLGLKSHDIDIATSMLPDDVSKVFTTLGFKVIPTGIQFGTVTLLYKGEVFEITTLRKDLICNGRHAKVEYTDDFYLDALRRDFTINALGYCPFEEIIYDYFDGTQDLKKGIVKFIGNPDERIREDYLRILRFFRFFGRFGKEIDQNSFDACLKHKSFLKNLSRERIKAEFDLILKLPNFAEIIFLMKEIIPEIWPLGNSHPEEVKCQPRHPEEVGSTDVRTQKNNNILGPYGRAMRSLRMPGEAPGSLRMTEGQHEMDLSNDLKYALLFCGSIITEKGLIALKFSRQEARNICKLLSVASADITEYFLKKIWLENDNFPEFFIFLNIINGENAEATKLFLQLSNQEKPKFPVNGHDLNSIGITGPDVKRALTTLQTQWIESDFQLIKEELLKLV